MPHARSYVVRAANKHRYALADRGLLTSSTCQMNGKSRLRALVARASLFSFGLRASLNIVLFAYFFGVIFVIFVISLDVSKPEAVKRSRPGTSTTSCPR